MADVVARALSALACGDDGRLTTVSQLTRSTVIGVCSRDRPASADCRAMANPGGSRLQNQGRTIPSFFMRK